jgi:pimeloyl-ACP methyl ester carboxylesterase
MIDVRVPVPTADGTSTDWEIAASVHLPAEVPPTAPVIVALPGGGYNRRYYDLPGPGFSQSSFHTTRGAIVVALDYLGAGDSSIPASEQTDLSTVAAATHAAVSEILQRIRNGTLQTYIGAVDVSRTIGIGQSLGGHIVLATQAHHRTFDAIAMLGSSVAGTVFAYPPDRPTPPEIADPFERLASVDFVYAFHWETESELVRTDVAAGLPLRSAPVAWGSTTAPACGAVGLMSGALDAEAEAIDVAVLLGRGERDVCRSVADEVAKFRLVTDIAAFDVPRMGHMHNFAETRELMWQRLQDFVDRVSAS